MDKGQLLARRVSHLYFAIAALLVLVNLLTTATDSTLSVMLRAWSVIPILGLGMILALLYAQAFWTRRRALEAQKTLVSNRRRYSYEFQARAAEERIATRLDGLPSRRPELEGALQPGIEASALSLARLADASSEECKKECALLDAYRVALDNLEIESLLRPGFFTRPEALHSVQAVAEIFDRPTEATISVSQPGSTVAPERRHSVVVLPFADLSLEQDQRIFADGLAEELINALSKLEGLRVIARSSAFVFGDQDRDIQEIGRKLQVETVLEGSIRKAANRLRITVQLIRVADAEHLWSDTYDRKLVDLLLVQDQIAADVVGQLQEKGLGGIEAPAVRSQTENLEAYHLYLKGRHFWNKRTPADLQRSVDQFEAAIARDPSYALAHVGLADALNLLGYYSVLEPAKAFPKSREAAQRALDLDRSLGEAHCSLAFSCLLYDWDWEKAGEEFARTFELNPGYATAHHWFAEYLAFLGRHDEAIDQAHTALALDPLSLIINVLLGWTFYYARRYDEAIEQLEETLKLDPVFAPAQLWLGLAYERVGDLDKAEQALNLAADSSSRSPLTLAALGCLFAERGERGNALAILEELMVMAENRYLPAYHIAAIHAASHENELAVEWLEKALLERTNWMVFLNIDPTWDRLRSEPRFRGLVQEIGLDHAGRGRS
jgi:TolB-like protein/Tfp pilus assembly protein PilF